MADQPSNASAVAAKKLEYRVRGEPERLPSSVATFVQENASIYVPQSRAHAVDQWHAHQMLIVDCCRSTDDASLQLGELQGGGVVYLRRNVGKFPLTFASTIRAESAICKLTLHGVSPIKIIISAKRPEAQASNAESSRDGQTSTRKHTTLRGSASH